MRKREPLLPPLAEADNDPKNIDLAVDRLRSLIERIERLEEEKAAIASDIRDIFAEAKSAGFDVKIMRIVIKLRKMSAADRDEQELLLEAYRKALDICPPGSSRCSRQPIGLLRAVAQPVGGLICQDKGR